MAEVLSDRELMLQVRSEGRVQLAASLLCDHDGLARRFETACERMLAQRLSGVRGAIDID